MTATAGDAGGAEGLWRSLAVVASAAVALAIAIWLLPASVHIIDWPRGGIHRVAVLAPLSRLVALLAAALLVTAVAGAITRQSPRAVQRLARLVSPLQLLWLWTIPYGPWVPDRLPLVLVGAGPARWVFAACAAAGVLVRLLEHRPAATVRWPGRWVACGVALALYAALGVRAVATTGVGGDEPHYLVITHSLVTDGDIKIENNHARGDYRAFFNGGLRPDYLQRGTNGAIYSIHAPGLPVLLIPGYLVAGGVGAVLTMCLLSALALGAIFELAAAMAGRAVAWLVWLTIGVSVPFIPHAWAIYPEMAGAAIVAWAMVWLIRDAPASAIVWMWRGLCLAWLPWLHTKFSVFLAGLVVLLAWRLRGQWRVLAALLVPPALSGVAWLAFFYVIYGTWDPQAPYGGYTAQFVRVENLPRSLLGLFFDQKFGLLMYAPIYALVIPGLWALRNDARVRVPAFGAAVLAAVYVVSSARLYMWWGGSSAPARFLVPVAPLLAPALALGIARLRGRVATANWAMVAGLSVAAGLGAAVWAGRPLLFSDPHGVARILERIQGSAPLTAAMPTFTEENWRAPLVLLVPWVVALLAGLVVGRVVTRRLPNPLWIAASEVVTFGAVAAALLSSFPASVRSEAQIRGALSLLDAFDPVGARAFDYARFARLTPQEWLSLLTVRIDHEPGDEPDPIGRISQALTLPPGVYDARVWFAGDRPRRGALQAAIGDGYLLARIDEPLANPAVLRIVVPVTVPALWVQLTDLESARAVRRLELIAADVEPPSERHQEPVVAVEAFPDRLGAYVAYLTRDAYPEHGVFWTRADAEARLRLVAHGADTLVMTVHVGPSATNVDIRVGDHHQRVTMAGNETREVRVTLPPGVAAVPVAVRADAFFRPAEVDASSSDARELGCQVRLVLE